MNSVTYRNGVMIINKYIEGYGGPSVYLAWCIFNNRVLTKFECTSSARSAVARERWRVLYSKMAKADVAHLAKNRPQFAPVCDQCEDPLYDGSTSQCASPTTIIYIRRCADCVKKTPAFEVSAETLARAKARELVELKKERRIRRAKQKKQDTPP